MTKRPPKDKFVLKEREKVESLVFDRRTLLNLSKLMRKGFFSSLDFPVSTGKEANVFRASGEDGFVAVKIYKKETSAFVRRLDYLMGDPRFQKVKHNLWALVRLFAKKEFKNLELCERLGVNAPRPFYIYDNVLVMEFLGEGGLPYPTLEQRGGGEEGELEEILENVFKLVKGGLVHADLSEYNIIAGDKMYLIDFGQGVDLYHPRAFFFLERDIKNVLRYFEKNGVKRDFSSVWAEILECVPPELRSRGRITR